MVEIDNLLKSFNQKEKIIEEKLSVFTNNEFNQKARCDFEITVHKFDKITRKFCKNRNVSPLKSVDAVVYCKNGDLLLIELKGYFPHGQKSFSEYIELLFQDGESGDLDKTCNNCGKLISKCFACNQPTYSGNCSYCNKKISENDKDGNIPKKLIDTICTLVSMWKFEGDKDQNIIEKLLVSNENIYPVLLLDANNTTYYGYLREQRQKNINKPNKEWFTREGGNSSLIFKNEVYVFNCTALNWYLKKLHEK